MTRKRLAELREAFEEWRALTVENSDPANGGLGRVSPESLKIEDWSQVDERGAELIHLEAAMRPKVAGLPPSVLTKKQTKIFGHKPVNGWGTGAVITATVRYDDECGNGHNTFAITGEIRTPGRSEAGGCLHEEIAKAFPELAPLIKWHLCSSDGPLHYIANTLYAAGDRDCWGCRKGEQKRDREGKPMWQLKRGIGHSIVCSEEKPNGETLEYMPVTGEGKERELDAARRSAIWPDATDDDLTAPGLEIRLQNRLPGLMAEFKAAVESLGFVF